MRKFLAQCVDLRFAQIDAIALLEDVQQKHREVILAIVGHHAVAAALATARRRKPDLACATGADDEISGLGISGDIVDN